MSSPFELRSRRDFLAGCSALAALPAMGGAHAAGATPSPCIDVHHHILPPFYLEETAAEQLRIAGPLAPAAAQWTPAQSIELMDQNGITASLVSISTPGIWAGGAAASANLARRCNEYAAHMISQYPGRFGWAAALPLPASDASLTEIAYAFDMLGADAVGLMTSYDNKWLGDASFDPVFEELNRRAAVVFVHPTAADCCVNLLPEVRAGFIEFPFDTTRAIVNLLYSGAFARYPRLRFIFSHGGGAMPMLNARIKAPASQAQLAAQVPHGVDYELRRHYYDTVTVTNPPAYAALSKLIPNSQILFGTDYPLGAPIASSIAGLNDLGLPQSELKRVRAGNAAQLLPRFRSLSPVV